MLETTENVYSFLDSFEAASFATKVTVNSPASFGENVLPL